jgi:MoxR-like ATPase
MATSLIEANGIIPAMADAQGLAQRLIARLSQTIVGKPAEIEAAVACVLSGGHLLLEDVPGVGKTLLAHSLATLTGGVFNRVQGTPDLLPGDVLGGVIPDQADGWRLRFREGPIFANVVLFDELNRTSPRTQSALLQAAEEHVVSIDGTDYPLPNPFILLATQNPLGQAGTFPLGEGIVDRFALSLTLGRASAEAERAVLLGEAGREHDGDLRPVTDPASLLAARAAVRLVRRSPAVADYVIGLLEATRNHPRIRLGASTRAGLSLIHLGQARALMAGRDFVTPADVQAFAIGALAHRVVLMPEGDLSQARDVIRTIVADVAVPRP